MRALWLAGCAISALCGQGAQDAPAAVPETWPIGGERVFCMPNVLKGILAFDSEHERPLFNYRLERSGLARCDSAGVLELTHGSVLAPHQGLTLANRVGPEGDWTIEAYLWPQDNQVESARTVFRCGEPESPNFSLLQVDSTWRFELAGSDHASPQITTAPMAPDSAQHVLVSIGPGAISIYVDGELAGHGAREANTPRAWTPGELIFGSGTHASAGWRGRLEGFAVHAEAYDKQQALRSSAAYGRAREARPKPKTREHRVRLLARSKVPTPADIAPYRESLAVFEYQILEKRRGFLPPRKIRVAHWTILDRAALPFGSVPLGVELTLSLEPFADNRQLESTHLADTLELDFDLELYFDAAGSSVNWKP